MPADVWTIVLGAGRRLASVTGRRAEAVLAAAGASSRMLDATLERFHPLAVPERTVTVVDGTLERLEEWLELRRVTSEGGDGSETPPGVEHVA